MNKIVSTPPDRTGARRSSRNRRVWDLLGVTTEVEAENRDDLIIPSAFLDAYLPLEVPEPASTPRLSVHIRRGKRRVPEDGREVEVHRTKHAYWTFAGLVTHEAPRQVIWPSRGLTCDVAVGSDRLDITVDEDLDAAFASEAAFHAIRSVALPLRARGALLHASGVAIDGRAVLFCGDVLAGKTTLMTECVLACGAAPLANDRVLLHLDEGGIPRVRSWPSYASFCEGTLLRYPGLARAAAAYEDEGCAYRTQRWPHPLENTFDKSRKRIYPMHWFAEAAGKRYQRAAPVGAVVFPHLTLDELPPRMRRLDLEEIVERLARVSFDHPDPSFRPWHGINLRETPAEPADVARWLVAADVPVLELVTSSRTLAGLDGVLGIAAAHALAEPCRSVT